MKNMIKLPAIVLGLMLLLTGTSQKVMAQDEDISLQSFYDELSPYGTWIQDSQYGYVWRPDADQGEFRPYYTNGRWVMTEYGNTWVSNYDWGWAPFHYGRWVYNRYNQWVWIPDTTWGPAWVSWRSGGGYYGWAPMGPGMNININFNIPDLWWVFVPQRNIYYDSFPRYYSRRNVVIINNTTIINNVYSRNRRTYYTGPRAEEIRRYTGRDVNVYNVNRSSRPSRSSINGDRIDMYRPTRGDRGNSNESAAPRNVVRGEGYATARPERGNRGSETGNTVTRPSRNENGGVSNGRGNDVGVRGDNNGRPGRPQRTQDTPSQSNPSREDRRGNDQPSQRPAERPQRQEQAPIRQSQPEAQPQARPAEQRPSIPQRQESRPAPQQQQPQPQRQQSQPQRVEQSRPSRSSESSRGSQGGGGSSSSSRPTRGSRG